MIHGLRFGAFTAVGPGSIPGWGTKIPQAVRYGQKKKKKFSLLSFSVFVLKCMCEHFRATTFVLRIVFLTKYFLLEYSCFTMLC